MQECCTCGSVRGALGNRRPYRDTLPVRACLGRKCLKVFGDGSVTEHRDPCR